jgi:serine O-acetyltransferase
MENNQSWQLDRIVAELNAERMAWRKSQSRARELGGRYLPSNAALAEVVQALCGALFPMRLGPPDLHEESEDFYVGHTLDRALNLLRAQVRLDLSHTARALRGERSGLPPINGEIDEQATRIVSEFALALPGLRRLLDTDVMAAFHGDPAARSVDEVLICYPGVLAIIHYRMAHYLYRAGAPLVARIIAELAHSATGIDIHPGAQIGPSFFIDHGTGVVIGETCIIGERVRLYQAVTLGAKRFPKSEDGDLQKGLARHPIVEDDVVVYAGATILGRVTIGKGSMVGGNVWLTRSVPPGSFVTQASGSETCSRDDSDL